MTPAALAAEAKLKFWTDAAFPGVFTDRTLTVVAFGARTYRKLCNELDAGLMRP